MSPETLEVTRQVTRRGDAVRFGVYVKPRSSRSKLLGVREGVLSVALRAPPVDGGANTELVELLAKTLGVKKSAITIVSGRSGRRKLLSVEGLSRATLLARLS